MTNKNVRTSLGKAGLFGWISLLLFAGGCVILWRPSEIGRIGFFIFWALILSVFYFADFLIITLPLHMLRGPKLQMLNVWTRSVLGGILFAVSAPIWSLLLRHFDSQDIFVHMILGFLSGSICFYFASRASETHES